MKWVPGGRRLYRQIWRLRVFLSSGIIDRPFDYLFVRTIPLSGCMDRRIDGNYLFSVTTTSD